MNELIPIIAQIEPLPTKYLLSLRTWIDQTLQSRWWAQHGTDPAVLQVLAAAGGDRDAVYQQLGHETPTDSHVAPSSPLHRDPITGSS